MKPLAIEYLDEGGVADGVGGDAIRDKIDLESDYDEDDENDEEDVEDGARDEEQDVEVNARVEEQKVEGDDDDDEDDDWLNEGLERDDFGDDIFNAQNSTP